MKNFDISKAYEVLENLSSAYGYDLLDADSVKEEILDDNDEINSDSEKFYKIFDQMEKCSDVDDVIEFLVKSKVVVMGLSTIFDNLREEIDNAIVNVEKF